MQPLDADAAGHTADERKHLEVLTSRLDRQKVTQARLNEELEGMTARYQQEHGSWIGFGEDDVLLRLGVKMSISRLQREGNRLRRASVALFAKVNWRLVPKQFIRNRIKSHPFLRRFLDGSGELEEMLEEEEYSPKASFLHANDSLSEPLIFASRVGRFLTGGSRDRSLNPRRAAWGREWDGGLTWRPEMSLGDVKARLRVPQDVPGNRQ